MLLYALVGAPWGRLPVFVTHLNWRLDHGSVRLKQVAFVAECIAEVAPPQAGFLPPVLMGDFNAAPDADEIRYLPGFTYSTERASISRTRGSTAETGARARPTTPGTTTRKKIASPPRRIDYIFTRGPDAELRGEPLCARLAFNEPVVTADGTLWPSDHFGVYAEIMVEARSL